MSALSDLQKKLEKESQGIMFPFSASTSTVDTTQNVYNSATDGIMNMQGKKYVGPDSVVQYGAEGQRNLKQIEAPMLPQFDATQFPKAGEGIVETPVTVTPPTIEPVQPIQPDQPAFDPCPVGFKLIDGVCQPIEQSKSDRQTGPTNPPRNIGPAANAVSQVAKTIKKQFGEGGLYKDGFKEIVTLKIDNSTILSKFGFLGKLIDTIFFKNPADKAFMDTFSKATTPEGIAIIKNKDGTINATFNQKGKENFDEIMTGESLKGNLASTQKTDNSGNIIKAPNGQPMIVGPITTGSFGTTSGKGFTKASQEAAKARANTQKQKEKRGTMGSSGSFKTGGGAPGYSKPKSTASKLQSKFKSIRGK